MAKKHQLVFVGSYPDYQAYCRTERLLPQHVLFASAVDRVRGYDLSESVLIVGDGPIREAGRLSAAMRERGMRQTELAKLADRM